MTPTMMMACFFAMLLVGNVATALVEVRRLRGELESLKGELRRKGLLDGPKPVVPDP